MKKIKKIFAVILSLAMVLGMSVTSFAEETTKIPSDADTLEVSVTGIKAKPTSGNTVTVTAYQVIKADYAVDNGVSRGLKGYVWTDGTGYTDRPLYIEKSVEGKTVKTFNIDETIIVALANLAKKGSLGAGTPLTAQGTTYSANLAPGSYVVLVTNSDDIVYNPMLVGVYYSVSGTDNTMTTQILPGTTEGGSLDASAKWELIAQNSFAKSTEPTITKEIVDPGSGNNKGDDVAIGDTVSFKINTAIPSYSDQYEAPQFQVSDEISAGLTYKEGTLRVTTPKLGTDGKTVMENIPENGYTVDPNFTKNGSKFTVVFTSAYIKANQNQDVCITYDAILNENAGINFDANTNRATLGYSHDPGNQTDLKEKNAVTYHYTFGIDAAINGANSTITKELLKTGEVVLDETTKEKEGLNGAVFTLTGADNKTKDKVYTTISGIGQGEYTVRDGKLFDKNNELVNIEQLPTMGGNYKGYLQFKGLDAGKYILREVIAPKGYSLNPIEIPVEITADYNEDGTLSWYNIYVNGKLVEENGTEKNSKYEVTTNKYQENTTTGIKDLTTDPGVNSTTQEIPNTKLVALPSTGGIGTTIFTIGGCAIMIIAAALFFASRRKYTK